MTAGDPLHTGFSGSSRRLSSRSGRSLYRAGGLLLLLAAWGLLLWRLNDVPPGFQHDQMFNSLDALSIGAGRYPLYFPANFGREALGIYPAALLFKIAGGHYVWSLRFASVMWSMATLSLTVALARRYLPPLGALFAGALVAGSFWFIFASRLGLEPAALIALSTGTIYFLNRGLVDRRWRYFAAAGLLGGLAVHTYLASRGLFLLLALLLGYELLAWLHRALRRSGPRSGFRATAVPGLLMTALLMAAISAPLFIYLQTRPNTGDLRVGELGGALSAVLTGDLRPLLANVQETVLAVIWSGPASIPYHYNVPGRPVLQPLLALFFLAGLVLTLRRLRRATEFLLLAALFIGLLPDFVTGADALHMRGVIALPVIFILVARGIWGTGVVLAGWLSRRGNDRDRNRRVWAWLAVALLLLLGGWHILDSSRAYFVDWAQAEPTQRIYNADFRAVATYLDSHASDDPIYIGTDRLLDLDSMTYQLYQPQRRDVRWFVAQEDLPLPTTGDARYFLPTAVNPLPATTARLMDAASSRTALPGPGGRYDLVQELRLSSDDVTQVVQRANGQPLTPAPAYGGSLQLDVAGAVQQGSAVELLTRWTVIGSWPYETPPGQPRQPIKFSASLVDGAGYRWAQIDQPSGLPFTFWRPADAYLELTQLPLPSDLPPGDYTVRLALYDDVGGAVMVSSESAAPTADAAVATVDVTSPIAGAPPLPPYPAEQTAGGDALLLLGKWEPLDFLVSGVPSDLHLSWLAGQSLATDDLHFRLRASAQDGSVLWEQSVDPPEQLPARWPAGQTYRLTHRIMPQTTEAGSIDVRLEVCALQNDAELVCGNAGQPAVVNQPPLLAFPQPPQHATDVNWNGMVTLAGYDLAYTPEGIGLALYWKVDSSPAAPLKRFVHAIDAAGQIVAQVDSTPVNGALPLPFWRTDETVVDQVELPMPPEVGVEKLCLGWYWPESGERLPVESPDGVELPDRQLCLPLDSVGSGQSSSGVLLPGARRRV